MTDRAPRAGRSCIAFVAGEASGDLLAAPVVRALRAQLPGYDCAGVAGERMIEAGCQPWHHVRELSVSGFIQVLPQLPRLLGLRRDLARRLQAGDCAVLVGVDAPDFNLALEAKVRAAGVPTVHYVSPSIWAWRAERIERIRRAADRMLLVFPFEQEIYDRAGIAATYVGHPLASAIPMQPDRAAARVRLASAGAGLGQAADAPLICLMPGSRRTEIEYIAPIFLAAAGELARHLPGARFVVPIADASLRPLMLHILARADGAPDPERVLLVDGHSHDCLEACHGVLVASGTATLEAALYKRPMVIAYRVPALSAWIYRQIGGYLPWVGLPNILARELLVPEFVQEQARAPQIAQAMLSALDDAAGQRRLEERFCAIHESLRRDTPGLATQAIMQTIAQAGARRT
jgi:lipid-A-disaccharide synthase